MRVVADTNVIVSGLLWGGPPNQILRWARDGIFSVLTCFEAALELKRVLRYGRLSRRIRMLGLHGEDVFAYFMNLAVFMPTPKVIPAKITADPFDNLFLALATDNGAGLIIAGDRHLLELKKYGKIEIVTAGEACQVIEDLLKRRN